MDRIIYRKGKKYALHLSAPLLQEGISYKVSIIPYMKPYRDKAFEFYEDITAVCENGILRVEYIFEFEGEYVISVLRSDFKYDNYWQMRDGALFSESIYALNDDLFDLNVYKVNFHMHSTASDGQSSPQEVCAYYREKGFDAIAITDHDTMRGSEIAVEFYRSLDMDLKLYYGEETQPVAMDPHIVNWGCDKSVNEYIRRHNEEYQICLKKLIKERRLEKFTNAHAIADCIYRVDKIREFNGLAILAHPMWNTYVNQVDEDVIDYLFEHRIMDAFELIGGMSVKSNSMQVNYYHEQAMKGITVPVVGNDDSHGPAYYFDVAHTLVFSSSDDRQAIKDAVKNGRVCVYEKNDSDKEFRLYGNFRLIRFGYFLEENFFPKIAWHYEREARLMRKFISGDIAAGKELSAMRGKSLEIKRNMYAE